MRLTIIFFLSIIIMACSKNEDGRLLQSFPQTYLISEVIDLGISTFFYTDSITYITGNDFVDELSELRKQEVTNELFEGSREIENFRISQISFTDPSSLNLNAFGQTKDASYTEISGLGVTKLPNGLSMGFKINPDLNSLISCYTIVHKRTIDTIYEGQFLSALDTLYNIDSTFSFQLDIEDSPTFQINACDPYDVNKLLSEFAAANGVVNNDRLIVHRTDFIFNKE